jgi:hypothetical protein
MSIVFDVNARFVWKYLAMCEKSGCMCTVLICVGNGYLLRMNEWENQTSAPKNCMAASIVCRPGAYL